MNMKTHLTSALSALLVGLVATATASDVLVYKVSLVDNWAQHQSARKNLPTSTSAMVGLTPIKGVATRMSYWVMDRGVGRIAELTYFTKDVDGVKQKLYQVKTWTFQNLGADPDGYTLDASGNGDQFMEVATLPTAKAGVNLVVMRAGSQYNMPDDFGAMTWHLSGTSTAAIKLSTAVTLTNVAATLKGDFLQTIQYTLSDTTGPFYFLARDSKGPHSAVLEKPLTLKTRTTAVGGLTPDTLNNGIQHVASVLEAQGYDHDTTPIF